MATNKYTRYKISRNKYQGKANYLARYGKKKAVIGRADTEKELIKLMASEAKKLEEQWVEEAEAVEEKEVKKQERKEKREAKKVGLWKPGGLIKKKSGSVIASPKSLSKTSTKEAIMQAKIKKAAAEKAKKSAPKSTK